MQKPKYIIKALHLLSLTVLLMMTGCDKYETTALDGTYTIKQMSIDGKDIMPNLCSTNFGFRSRTSEAWFNGSALFEKDHHAQWVKLTEDKDNIDSIEIKSKVALLSGRYKVVMSKKHNSARLDLISKNVRIESYKIVD
jgi:hypothetical protein